jgi:hypothetical protein
MMKSADKPVLVRQRDGLDAVAQAELLQREEAARARP